ncbi:MAG TPA: FHA domain-containing protein [Rhizobacter sp.]|nr:FHA domain-containing protein [Rhizobacter sp.]
MGEVGMGEVAPTLAVLEVLDRDGSVRHSVSVREWPLRAGRALDNDLVLDDAHTAAHHFSVAPDEQGQVMLVVGDSINGLQCDARQLAAGERVAVGALPPLLAVGRMHLRLRLAGHALAPEQPLRALRPLTQGLPTLALLALGVALALLFGTYLENDPEAFTKALGSLAIYAMSVALGWAGLWTLLSKVFTRQGHFGWHLRVLLIAVLVWELVSEGSSLLAFAFSWPWLTDFTFIAGYVILGAMLYFHLQAVEPHHPRRTRSFAVASVVIGVGLSLWFNYQGSDRLGSELYMNHLFPPALRLARPVDTERFMQGVGALQPTLDAKAKKDGDD